MKKFSILTLLVFAVSMYPTETSHAYGAPHKKHFQKKRTGNAPVKKVYRKKAVKKKYSPTYCNLKNDAAYNSVPVQVKPMETSYIDNGASGFYFGFGVSAKYLSGNHNLVTPADKIDSAGLSATGLGGEVHFGYAHKFDSWGASAELYFDPLSLMAKNDFQFNNQLQQYRLKMKNTYGIALRVGYHVSPTTLIFGRLGVESTKMELRFTDSSNVMSPVQKSTSKFAPTFGFGVRDVFSENWAYTLEYVYSMYNKHTFTNGTTTTRVRPSGHALKVSMSYII
jgi:opacity protein-like surface antigen